MQLGGTVKWAEPPSAIPNYIFPFASLKYFSVDNISQFQFLLYRPLYFFGNGNDANIDYPLSIGQAPVYANGNTTATISLNSYKWSNGESVTATDVLFWMNMMHAEAKANWAGYAPGTMPDNVSNVTVDSPTQVSFTMTHVVNPHWMTYNQFGEITPMPLAWDVTSLTGASGSGGCSGGTYGSKATDTACTAVYNFLNAQAQQQATYTTSKIWTVVDGPWKLKTFDTSGDVAMVPNPSYSGPSSDKPKISEFDEVPYTTDTSEFNALVGGKTLTVGYLPSVDVTSPAISPTQAGPNNTSVAGSYYLDPWYLYGINYFPLNFDSTGDGGVAGKIFSQTYFRQAMQTLVDQTTYINKLFKGYGVPTYGPVPIQPKTFASSVELSAGGPLPYSVSAAKSLLTSNGWNVVPNGVSTCSNPGTGSGQCGAGIPKGAQLNFSIEFATGSSTLPTLMQDETSSWAAVGIKFTTSQAVFNTVLAHATPCPSGCSWEFENWGGGWVFSPDYYPTGEEIFETGAGSNSGNYSDPTNDANIKATDDQNIDLITYENYLAKSIPVIWQPNPAYALTEVTKNLRGVVGQQSAFGNILPEQWYFVKS